MTVRRDDGRPEQERPVVERNKRLVDRDDLWLRHHDHVGALYLGDRGSY